MVLNYVRGWWEDIKAWGFMEWCVILIIAFFVYVMIYGKSVNSYSMHMKECIADGHKGYECRGILKGARYGK